MEQLKMYWKNDGKESVLPTFPNGITLTSFAEIENAENEWIDIVKDGSLLPEEKVDGVNYYVQSMNIFPTYKEEMCYIIKVNGNCAATLTVICDYDKKAGLVHMVACKPEFRGLGLGNLLTQVALYTLKKENMQTASLKTDDWRIPAIKTYLKIGFTPDVESQPDYKERWDKIFEIINNK